MEKLWISRGNLWIKPKNWGKLAILFELLWIKSTNYWLRFFVFSHPGDWMKLLCSVLISGYFYPHLLGM